MLSLAPSSVPATNIFRGRIIAIVTYECGGDGVESANDGPRPGDDRAHLVDASAAIGLRGDRARVLTYRDGLTNDAE